MPGLEDRMNIVFSDLVSSGLISAERYVEITSTKAAKIFNIYPQKGAIMEGSDADVIIIDPKAKKTISQKTSHHAVDYNAYEGRTVNGFVVTTISRGVVVWENSKLTAVRGAGKFVPTPAGGSLFEGLEQENETKKEINVERP
jgi:dihydropyrimidinase